MKKIAILLLLSLTIINANANCIDKATVSINRLVKIDRAIDNANAMIISAIFNATTPWLIGMLGVRFEYAQLDTTRNLLIDASNGGGETLDIFAESIKSSRADLASDKSKLANILKEANEKETICAHGLFTGSLLRSLVMDGDVEKANAADHKISLSDFEDASLF